MVSNGSKIFNKKVKVLLACEFVIFRKALKSLIEEEESFSIIGEAKNKNEIFNIVKATKPDIIIINTKLPSDSIHSLCKNIHEKYPKLPILLFLDNIVTISIAETIINGVRGIIWKENSKDELIKSIYCLVGGGTFFEDPEDCRLSCHFSKDFKEKHQGIELEKILSPREYEILKLIADGLAYTEIANKLLISSRTVESHKNHIISKLNLRNKNELVRFAILNNIYKD